MKTDLSGAPASPFAGLRERAALPLAIVLCLWLGFPNDLPLSLAGLLPAHLPVLPSAPGALPGLVLLLPPLLALTGLRAHTAGQALRTGWLSCWAGHVAALYWLALPIHNVGGLPWALAVPCAVFVAGCLSSAGGLFACAAFALRRRPPLVLAALLGLCWYLLEWGYAVVAGFPWLPLSGALAVWPLFIQPAHLVGGYLLAGIWAFMGVLCLMAPRGRHYPLLAVLLLLASLGYGAWRLHQTPAEQDPQGSGSFAVLFVEGNIDQNQKWLPAFQRSTVDTYLALTEQALARHPGEHPLIIWPETAMPYNFAANTLHTPRIRQLAARARSPLLTGAPAFEGTRENMIVYNRAYLLGPDGSLAGYYDKEHLVPFGEYLPSWLDWDLLSGLLQEVGVYTPGSQLAPLRSSGLELGMLICYEGVFPWLAQQRVADGANVLVDISNDGWFGRSPAAMQHLALTTVRAVEQDRWILRGTNTGISAIIDSRGRVVTHGRQFEEAAIWGRARISTSRTVYHHLAPWLPGAAALLALLLLVVGRCRRNP